ncbi:hypothetical protein GCM10027562_22390 [Arthrobacter pigmenti]
MSANKVLNLHITYLHQLAGAFEDFLQRWEHQNAQSGIIRSVGNFTHRVGLCPSYAEDQCLSPSPLSYLLNICALAEDWDSVQTQLLFTEVIVN